MANDTQKFTNFRSIYQSGWSESTKENVFNSLQKRVKELEQELEYYKSKSHIGKI